MTETELDALVQKLRGGRTWVTAEDLERAAATLDRLAADLAEARKVIEPFADEKLPTSRRIKIAYDRHGLRRAMSDLEIAQDAARAFIKGGE